ncbi:MAG: hypothetical protein KGM15_00350 [Pseudomonadota bacterium]|nr:hypothetical protein [Pseudomonadota bacterium]
MRFASLLTSAAALLLLLCQAAPAYLQKKALIFELDEGYGNGVVEIQDMTALRRIAANLRAFATKFEIYALLPASVADRSRLTKVLDALQAEGIPFVLEAESSDTIAINSNAANAPYDAAHGFGASVEEFRALKARYGRFFAGIRFMEVFGETQQIIGCQRFAASWCGRFAKVLPSDNFFEKSLVEPYVAFAQRSGMFVLFGDHFWAANYDPRRQTYDGLPYFNKTARVTPSIFNDVIKQPQNERDLQDLAAKYPGAIVALYDNNDGAGGVDSSAAKIDTWEAQIMRPLIATGGFRGFGLSDQAWLCPERPVGNDGSVCPVEGVITWADKALAQGALVIETEPYWYWFQLPPGVLPDHDYTGEPQWADRGYATSNLQALASHFGVALPAQSIRAPVHRK